MREPNYRYGFSKMTSTNIFFRQDIQDLVNLNDEEFEKWYTPRKDIVTILLNDYQLFGSIPNLNSSHNRENISSYPIVKDEISYYNEALNFLDEIKKAREEYKKKQTKSL